MTSISNVFQNQKAQANKVLTNATVTGSLALDLSVNQFQQAKITGNTTISFSNASTTTYNIFVLELINAGSFTITWPGSMVWSGAVAPTLSTSGKDIITLLSSDGVNWKASRSWRA